jgi:hypothetical protein
LLFRAKVPSPKEKVQQKSEKQIVNSEKKAKKVDKSFADRKIFTIFVA